ncbi:MAG: tetratricopeptide repeat protein [Microcoleaceae cyanobacterium]
MTEQLIRVKWSGWISLSLTILLGWSHATALAIETDAQETPTPTEEPLLDEFSPNPLNSNQPDELLPNPPLPGQFLSPTRQERLAPKLEQLNTEATALLEAGNLAAALNLWMRELRLRRYFGVLPEITALRRVGTITLNNNQQLYAKFITERLQQILQQVQSESKFNSEILQTLGLAFQDLAAKDLALETYQTLLNQARQQDNILTEELSLRQMADVYLTWLDYPQAAKSYEELLTLQQQISVLQRQGKITEGVRDLGERQENATTLPNEIKTLQQLAFVYEQIGEYLQAIAAKERLVGYYSQQQEFLQLPKLKLSIGENYEQLQQYQQAAQNYQEAYQLSTGIQQYIIASDALEKLGKLYHSQNQKDAALELYQAQLLIYQQSYNWIGMMSSYDKIGEIYLEKQAYPQALLAFQQGLKLANQLKYKEDYFSQKIKSVNQNINR